jgi:hypothetical protein
MADLPFAPQTDGFSIQHGNDTRIFEPMFGKRRARRIGLGNPDVIGMSWVLSGSQYDTFLSFYYITLASGSLPFNAVIRGVTRSCRFIGDLGTSGVDGDTYSISANVEVLR